MPQVNLKLKDLKKSAVKITIDKRTVSSQVLNYVYISQEAAAFSAKGSATYNKPKRTIAI